MILFSLSLKKKLNISQKKTRRLKKKVSFLMTLVSELKKKKTLSVVIVLIFWKKLFKELLRNL